MNISHGKVAALETAKYLFSGYKKLSIKAKNSIAQKVTQNIIIPANGFENKNSCK